MTHDQIDRIVRQANPVPDLKALEPVDASVLVLDKQRRTEMQTHDRVEVDRGPEKPRYGTLIGIAAAAAIVIGVLVLFRPGGNAPVAAEPTAVEIATGFVEAYAAFDADKAASYLADNALAEFGGFGGDVEDLRLGLSQGQAAGFKLLFDSCEAQNSSPSGTSVRCAYDYHGIRSDEIGLGPYTGSWFDITVLEGEIVSVSDHIQFMSNGFSAEMWEPFAAWVAETYPDDVAVMYTDSSQTMASITEESNQLWELRSREYAELHTSELAYGARANEICAANKARQAEAWEAAEVEMVDVEEMPGENILVSAVMMEIAIPILEEGLAELRLVPPPEAVRSEYERDYLALEQEIEYLRKLVAGVDSPNPGPAAHRIQLRLQNCTIGG